VRAEDTLSIAEGLCKLATNSSLRQQLRTAGRGHAAQFTWERSGKQLLAAYQKALAS
jgi:glycosyltransferase involved in cell wall biosynthesis